VYWRSNTSAYPLAKREIPRPHFLRPCIGLYKISVQTCLYKMFVYGVKRNNTVQQILEPPATGYMAYYMQRQASDTLAAPTTVRNASIVLNFAGEETPADTIVKVGLLSTKSTTAGAARVIHLMPFDLNNVRVVFCELGHSRRLFLLQNNFGVLFCG